MLHEASRIRNHPSVKGYTDFFIHISDVVAVNHILCRAARTPGRVVMLYAGDNHRLGVLRFLRKIVPAAILAESKDPKDNSCSQPLLR